MERIWALINAGKVVNTIVAEEVFISGIERNYESILEITSQEPRPSIGWTMESDGLRSPKPGPNAVWDANAREWITQE